MEAPISQPAPLWRRLAAAGYDALLMLGAWMFVLLLDEIIRDSLLGLPVNYPMLRVMALGLWLGYFGWSWTRSGQTLGLRAWKLRVQRPDGSLLGWREAALRYAVAWLSWGMAGLGLFWCLVDARKRAWHDLASGAEIIRVEKPVSA